MNNTVLYVILKNKDYRNARVLHCLMNKNLTDVDLVIINTGPVSLRFDKSFIHTLGFYVRDITISESLNERQPGALLNRLFTEHNAYARYLVLHEDSLLPDAYLHTPTPQVHTVALPHLRLLHDQHTVMRTANLISGQVNCSGSALQPQEMKLSGMLFNRAVLEQCAALNEALLPDNFVLMGPAGMLHHRIAALSKRVPDISVSAIDLQECLTHGHRTGKKNNPIAASIKRFATRAFMRF